MRSRHTHEPVTTTVHAALEQAVRAPSLHNSQPWLWRANDNTIRLYLDQSRWLPATDPQARELIISCGAALHHLLVALGGMGQAAHVQRLPDPMTPSLLAEVSLRPGPAPSVHAGLAPAIGIRRTDRRRFTAWPAPSEVIGQLRELAVLDGMLLQPITEPDQRWKLYRAITTAAEWQAADPRQVDELTAWSGKGPDALDGVPSAHIPDTAATPGQPPMREFARSGLAQPPVTGEPEGSTLLLLSTPADNPLHWLRAGELTSMILLTATLGGLASSPLTQPLEVSETREFLRAHIAHTNSPYPQILLRLGWLPPGTPRLPATPRRAVSEVLAPLHEWRGI